MDGCQSGCSAVFEPVANFTHSVIKAAGRLVQAGSRVGFLLLFTVTSHLLVAQFCEYTVSCCIRVVLFIIYRRFRN